MRDNPIKKALSKETQFVEEVTDATSNFFNSENLEVLHKSKDREIKAYRDKENMVVYVMDKQDKKIIVNIETIYDWNKNSSIKDIIHWQYKEKKNIVEKNLYMNLLIECNLEKSSNEKNEDQNVYQTAEEFENSIMSKVETEEQKEVIVKILKDFKKIFGEKYFENEAFKEEYLGGSKKRIDCTTDVGDLWQYAELLNKNGYLSKVYEEKFFSELNKEAIPKYQQMLSDWVIGMNKMSEACEVKKYTSKDKAFEFNDLDNHVWTRKGNLILTNQNIGFYFNTKDDNNFVVYYLVEAKNPGKIDKKIEDGTIKELKDMALKVENGQIVYLNYALMYSFELDMEFSVKAMKEKELFKIEYPVDITTYQYQKDYYAHKYNLNEFEFITQAMMTIGGGFNYDKEKGEFVDDNVKYVPNLPKAKNTRNQIMKGFNYLYPKKISYLNEDWLDGLKYAVGVLKKDMPKPLAFEGDDESDALEKAIKYYEIKIAKLEGNVKKPNIR